MVNVFTEPGLVLYTGFSSEIKCVILAVSEMKYEVVGRVEAQGRGGKAAGPDASAASPRWTAASGLMVPGLGLMQLWDVGGQVVLSHSQ